MGNKLLDLLTFGNRLKTVGGRAAHTAIGTKVLTDTGRLFGIPGSEQISAALSPGTYIDKSGIRPLINAKNAYEDMIYRAYEGVNPWIARDEFHSAYDPTGRFAGLTDVAARAGDVLRNTGAGVALFPLPGAADFMFKLNSLGAGLDYLKNTYNTPFDNHQWKSFKYMPIIPSGVDGVSLTPEELAYNEKAKQHNLHVNDPIKDSDYVWKHAYDRTRQLQDLITKAVIEGHQKKMSTAQINARIKKIKNDFTYTGGDVMRAGVLNAKGNPGNLSPAERLTQANVAIKGKPIRYEYESWDKR